MRWPTLLWKGENIGEKAANSVVYFTAVKGRAPSSLQESLPFWEENHKKKFEYWRVWQMT